MQFRFDFVTATAAQSPILESWTMMFIMRPLTKMGYSFRIPVMTNARLGSEHEDERTAEDILTELQTVRNSVSPVELVDIQGKRHMGYVTALQEMAISRKMESGGDTPDIEYNYQVNFVEVL